MLNTRHSGYVTSDWRIRINAIRKRHRLRYLFTSLILVATLISNTATAFEPDIWTQLRQGGHILLIRHGMVDSQSKSTSPDADFEGCEGQYNLIAAGDKA